MQEWFNPMELAEDSQERTLPNFLKGKFVVLKIVPPKGKGIRDGLVLTAGLLSYEEAGKHVDMVELKEGPSGWEVALPFGKRGIMATKYRGPKSYYRFKYDDSDKFYYIGKNDPKTKINELLTEEGANKVLESNVKGWLSLDNIERDNYLDEYYENFYMYGFAKDLNLPLEDGKQALPQVGMVTDFYREYTPPERDEKYGNTIITKWTRKTDAPELSGEYGLIDPEAAVAIYNALIGDSKPEEGMPF